MNKPYIALFISVVSVSFAAIFIVSVDAPSLSIAFFRLLFTTMLILPVVLLHKKTRDELKTLPRWTLYTMIGIGVVLAAHFALWITSLEFTSVASSVILVTAHPIIVGPISHFFLKERLSFANIMGIIISFSGVIVLVYGNYGFATSIDTLEGNLLAWAGGVAAGLYILGGRHLRCQISVIPYVFVVYTIATIVLFIFCLMANISFSFISQRDIFIIFSMAVISGIFGHTLYNWSLAQVRASVASVALLGEPIGSSLFAFILPWINQIPSIYTIIGGTIIILGIFFTTRTYSEPISSNSSTNSM